jgi:hypothetical protein
MYAQKIIIITNIYVWQRRELIMKNLDPNKLATKFTLLCQNYITKVGFTIGLIIGRC